MKKINLFNTLCVVVLLNLGACSSIHHNTNIACYEQVDTVSNCFDNRECTGKWEKRKKDIVTVLNYIDKTNQENKQRNQSFVCIDRQNEIVKSHNKMGNSLPAPFLLLDYYLDTQHPLTQEDFEILFSRVNDFNIGFGGSRVPNYTRQQAKDLLQTPIGNRPYLTYRQHREHKAVLFEQLPKEKRKELSDIAYKKCGFNCTINELKQIIENMNKGQ